MGGGSGKRVGEHQLLLKVGFRSLGSHASLKVLAQISTLIIFVILSKLLNALCLSVFISKTEKKIVFNLVELV